MSWNARSGRAAVVAALVLLTAASAAWGQPAYLVRDLFPGSDEQLGVYPSGLFSAGDRVYFFGSARGTAPNRLIPDDRVALWATDGSAAGTLPLAVVGGRGAYLATLGSLVLFLDGPLLWRSDGTRAGTLPLTASGPGVLFDSGSGGNYALGGGLLYFVGCQANCGQLWRTDGTAAGTRMVADLAGSTPLGSRGFIRALTAFRSWIFFLSPAGTDGTSSQLWRSDGTASGTSSFSTFIPGWLTPSDRTLYLTGADPQGNLRLWVTDGESQPQPIAAFKSSSTWLKTAGSRIYFLADDGIHGEQIWVSDGTAAGTLRITGFTDPAPFTLPRSALGPNRLVEVLGDQLVFFANSGGASGLWAASAGSPPSVAPLCSGACGQVDPSSRLVRVGGRVVFLTGTQIDGFELWGSDGTPLGTQALKQACSLCTTTPSIQLAGGMAFFPVTDPRTGNPELWQTDGSISRTRVYPHHLIASSFDFADSSLEIAKLGSRLLFTAPDAAATSDAGVELWVTDGTEAGTSQLTDVALPNSSSPTDLAAMGNLVFFTAASGPDFTPMLWQSAGDAATTVPVPAVAGVARAHLVSAGSLFFALGNQLWRADGTAAGTRQLTNLSGGAIGRLVAFPGGVYFVVSTGAGTSIWRSDGTVAGTGKVLDLPAFPDNSGLDGLWAVAGSLYFTVTNYQSFVSTLWRSDGTTLGTLALTRVPYQRDPQPIALGSSVYFVGGGNGDAELWRTDGTPSGTGPLMVGSRPVAGDLISNLREVAGILYFSLANRGSGNTLWRSDGTAGGSFILQTFQPNFPSDAEAGAVTPLNGRLLFLVQGGPQAELWASDGTAAGTVRLRAFGRSDVAARASDLTLAGSRVFFSADDGIHGSELWQSDGTAEGTRLVQDIWPGPAGSGASGMTPAGGLLFFAANDGLAGSELWALPLGGGAPCRPGPAALCLQGGRFEVKAFWRDFRGGSGTGQAVALTPDTGYFWFFSPDSVELVTKVLDGRGVDGHFWFFYGALSSVEYYLTVTDTLTGAAGRYGNPPGQLASVADTSAFGPRGAFVAAPQPVPRRSASPRVEEAAAAEARSEASPGPGCQPAPARLCLSGGRFAVTVTWQDHSGGSGRGQAVDLSADTGYFWFFNPENLELMIKVLDGRQVNGKFWVFYGALSDVAYTITVRDTVTGTVKTYENPAGQLASQADTSAF
jgi:ELWxxDGT repeat protein